MHGAEGVERPRRGCRSRKESGSVKPPRTQKNAKKARPVQVHCVVDSIFFAFSAAELICYALAKVGGNMNIPQFGTDRKRKQDGWRMLT